MTQTASFKDKLKHGFSIFRWELRNCSASLTVFAILAAVFTAIILTLALVIGYNFAYDYKSNFDYGVVLTAVGIFQIVATYAVFYLNAIFTIIYTIKIYSYLHNKRKADMYGAMPISRRTFYVAKTISAYVLSIVPTLFFFSIIAIISVCFGQPVIIETAKVYVQLLLGSIACISFYGLLSVCCGTTVNAVLTFVAINFAYPITMMFIKGTISAFYCGLPTVIFNNSFIIKALRPLAAYDGLNVIYWLIFTAVCLFLGIWLIKKRKAECAQTSFAYSLPCYLVKLLIAFIIGMFLGVLFASLNLFNYGYAGFIFGFILGSVPAYAITHLILYKGFSKIIKTAIPLGVLVLATVAMMGFCEFDPIGYASYVPKVEDVQSAGLVDFEDCYYLGKVSSIKLANMASDDFTDKDKIESITKLHKTIVDEVKDRTSTEKFRFIWANMLFGNVPDGFYNEGYCVSYTLNNGWTTYRYYDSWSYDMYDNYYYRMGLADDITESDEYFKNYSAAMNAKPDEVVEIAIDFTDLDVKESSYSYYDAVISKTSSVDDKQVSEDIKKLVEAYRKDYIEKGSSKNESKYYCELSITFDKSYDVQNSFVGSLFGDILSYLNKDTYDMTIDENYDNTIAVLKEMGILVDKNSINASNEYVKNRDNSFYY